MFDVGTFWFWVLIVIGSIMLIALVENGRPVISAGLVIVSLALLDFYGNLHLVDWISTERGYVILYVLGWLAIGAFWSFIGWWLFTRQARNQYEKIKSKFLSQRAITGRAIPDSLKKEWRDTLALSYSFTEISEIIPRAGAHKRRIITSIIYWPWSLVWGALIKQIWSLIQALLQVISSSAFRGVDKELAEDDEAQDRTGTG